ncbi:hypothetical protein [Lentzea nigeriaca]|uniref:hypothetical protein n=1 Tax=Lentzea nigeriaca TaxID=1128665 RepID=UPI001959D025|nr:hypothetical protein [Lentzea nigeriaca]MBM7864943.1 hypothetical protein [Lentzea nigeriaca]
MVDTVAAIIASGFDVDIELWEGPGRCDTDKCQGAPDTAPALHWHVDTGNWLVLGFEHVGGRHPDFSPGSPDIAPTTEAVRELHAKLTPCPAKVANFAGHWRQLSAWQRIESDDVDPWTRQHLDRCGCTTCAGASRAGWRTLRGGGPGTE